MRIFRIVALAVLLLNLPGWSQSEDAVHNELSTFSLYLDNDLPVGSDRYYTHGTRMAIMTRDMRHEELYWLGRQVLRLLPEGDNPDWGNSLGFALGQHIFTPEDLESDELVNGDHPYAGYIFVAASLHHRSRHSLHMVELTLGAVGPNAISEHTQRYVHEARNIDVPRGWDRQLGNELAAMAAYEYRRRDTLPVGQHGLEFDLVPRLGLRVGNYRTELIAGATLRFGYQIPDDFHNSRMDSAGYGRRPDDTRNRLGLYCFVGTLGRAIARDMIIDRSSSDINRKVLVGQFEAGIGVRVDKLHLLYSHVYMSRQFDEQRNGHRYGALTFIFTF